MTPEAQAPAVAAAAAAETPPPVPAEVLATLAEIGEEVNASLDLDEVLSRTAALIKRHIDYEFFGVLLKDGDGSYLTHRFAMGYPPGLAENLRVPVGQGITGTAAAPAIPSASDTMHDPRYINAIDNVRSELAVPLMLPGKVIGVLDMQSRHLNISPRISNELSLCWPAAWSSLSKMRGSSSKRDCRRKRCWC